jgi:hypothetical protein
MTSILQPEFILYLDDRPPSAKDVCSNLVHITVTQTTHAPSGLPAFRLTLSPSNLNQVYIIQHSPGAMIPEMNYVHNTLRVMSTGNNILYKKFYDLSNLFKAKKHQSGEDIPVYKISGRAEIFKGGPSMKRNVGFSVMQNSTANNTDNLVPHRKRTAQVLQSTSPFLAKQALELAIMKKDTCPITLDDFSASNTAVMPCGHLFSTLAIAESFKKCPNQCPVCRTAGLATFV